MQYTKCKDYKYQLQETQTFDLHSDFPDVKGFDWVSIKNNKITIQKGYAWDGCSGPTIDTKNSMVAGLVHDCLYQLMRLKRLDISYRPQADKEFYLILREHRMNPIRAKIWYLSVKLFAKSSATKLQSKEKIIYTA